METIDFRFELQSNFVSNPPRFSIYNNDKLVFEETPVQDLYTAEFSLLMSNQIENVLQIMRTNHDERTDQQLILNKVYADDIDLENILNQGKYYPIYPEPWHSQQKEQNNDLPEYYSGSLCWGWNGVWKLEYTTPFYQWLLKNA
jgi:hypothetical protein